jgi:hypothetical protein
MFAHPSARGFAAMNTSTSLAHRGRRAAIALLFASIAGCISTVPPAPQLAPRTATTVAAPFGKTWTAVVDVFADKNVGIRTIDRSSGLIVADPVTVSEEGRNSPHSLADCGSTTFASVQTYNQPTSAIYNVRVRGDSTSSTVLVTLRYVGHKGTSTDVIDCASKGTWESAFETAAKVKAEKP